MMANYYGSWSDYNGLQQSWFESEYDSVSGTWIYPPLPDTFPKEEEVLFASYGGGAYEGDATMVWRRDGKLYECHGSHCSCYGLEGQFEPEETSLEVLAGKGKKEKDSYWYFLSDHDEEAQIAYWKIVEELQAEK